jgi:hypothetical protein
VTASPRVRFSLIVPTLNEEARLPALLESIGGSAIRAN